MLINLITNFKLIIVFLFYLLNSTYAVDEIKQIMPDGKDIQYAHEENRTYLSSDYLALDTEIEYAKSLRYGQGGDWANVSRINLKIANRGHPIAQLHLGKQYVNGNGLAIDLVEAYKWFALSDTAIGKHYIEIITEDMTKEEIKKAKIAIKEFKAVYK